MPAEQRDKVLQLLRKFELELPADKQREIRELDRRIADLDPQARSRHLWALRRYHDWLNSLPENQREIVLSLPPSERMATVKKLAITYPVPSADTPRSLRISEAGELSPFELASAFRIWQKLTPALREKVDGRPLEKGRREALFQLGKSLRPPVPRETRPADFDEEKSLLELEELEKSWRGSNPILVPEEAVKRRTEKFDELAKKKVQALQRETNRRQAINLYFSKTKLKPVDPERLAQFLTSLPSWLQSSFDQYPADEARRRLTLAYRLVFPHPKEIGSSQSPPSPSTKSEATNQIKKTDGPAISRKPAAPIPTDSPF